MTASRPSVDSGGGVLPRQGSLPQPHRGPRGAVYRGRLVGRLVSGDQAGLAAIVAPAGYGKTTLLGQVAGESPNLVIWLTLDERCADPAVLASRLLAALESVLQEEGRGTALLPPSHGPERSEVAEQPGPVDRFLSAAQAAGRRLLLVVDDVHHLQSAEALETLWTLFEGLPNKSQMLLAGREAPNLPLARERANGDLVEIGPRELAFSFAEVQQLFSTRGVAASDDTLRALVEKTGGWVAALNLAAHASASDAVPRVTLRSFGSRDRLLATYVKSEVLERLPDDLQAFLVNTAVLRELRGPLCDHVLQRGGSAQILVDLEERYRLVVPLDRERVAYEYSPMLREALHHELSVRDAKQEAAIHKRASQWYEMQGDTAGAVGHAQAVDDVDRVASLLVAFGVREYARGRAAELRSWFEWLEQHRDFPKESAVVGAWLHLLDGRAEAAKLWAEYAEAAPLSAPMPDGSPCEGWLFTLRAAVAVDIDVMKASSRRALETLSFNSPWRPTALSILGCAEMWSGELEASDANLTKASEIGLSLGANAAAATALAARAELEMRRENWLRAHSLVNESVAIVERCKLANYVTSSLTFSMAGYCAARQGDRATATKYLDLAQTALAGSGLGPGLLGLQCRLSLIRVHLALGETGTAFTALKDVERLARDGANLGSITTDIESLATRLSSLNDEAPHEHRITAAEMRLLPLLASAYSLREIADQLFLSTHTVKSHAASIYRKLGVSSRAHAVERASALGLVSAESHVNGHYVPEPREPLRSRPSPVTAP
ncbi:MAG: LuxR C-terminal-related transcriptional regulator [Steroidobacteraceae bacterium]